jgi:hypothetical protein
MITCIIDSCKQVIWLHLVLKYFQIVIQKSYHDGSKFLDRNDDKCHNKMHSIKCIQHSIQVLEIYCVPSLAKFPTQYWPMWVMN